MMNGLYRLNAAAIVFNSQGKVLVFGRNDIENQWQFPQGGIEPNETPEVAARRELKEETNIQSVRLVAIMPQPLRYDFPPQVLEKFKKLGRTNIGQEQYWFLFYFEGSENEIDFTTNPDEIEFKAYKWIEIDEAPNLVVDFKKEVYQRVVKFMKPKIDIFLHKQKCHD